uniref:Glycosyltransferase family 92 protein n=1 Tax=Caenorhabditis tropicalis TaxID=1561998 RepID=A0A1I7V1X1_9PELO
MNICALDIKTDIGTIADLDEIMVARNGTTLEYALKEMETTNVGALSFENNYVAMEPSIYTSGFSGVAKPIFFERGGPRKVTKLFGKSPPPVNLQFIETLNKCVNRIGGKGLCHSTGGLCKSDMDKVNEWVYDKTEELFL